LQIFLSSQILKSRAFAAKSCQNISITVAMIKKVANHPFAAKSCQNISITVVMTKKVANLPFLTNQKVGLLQQNLVKIFLLL
jgi:hypothetical protein